MGLVMLLGSEQVQKELQMTEEQKNQLKKMNDANQKEMRKRMEEFRKLSREERQKRFQQPPEKFQEELAKREKETKAKLAEILKPEQLKRLKQIQFQQAGVMVLLWPEVAEELGLTSEQKDQLKKIGEEAWKKMGELRPPRGRQRGDRDRNRDQGGREEMRKQMQEMRKRMQEMRQEIEKKSMGVLTAEQKTKLGEIMGKPFKLDRSQMRRGWGGQRGEGRRGPRSRRGQDRRSRGTPRGGQSGGEGPGEPI